MSAKTDPVANAALIAVTSSVSSKKDDSNPWSFDTTPLYTLQNAMAAIAKATNNLLSDQTALISGVMAYSANLMGPLTNSWAAYWQQILNNDEGQISYWAGQGNQQQVSSWSNQMNVDNSGNSSTSSGYNNTTTSLGQQISGMTSNYQNVAQLANTVVTGLTSAINSDWVI